MCVCMCVWVCVRVYVCVWVCSLAHCPIFGSGFRAVGPRDRLDRRGQGTEESRDEGEAQAPPCTEHGPSIAMADVIRESIQVAWVA